MFSQQQYDEWSKDPKNWIWGIFYYNKLDDRSFQPKRNPNFGITINFARQYSIPGFMLFVSFFAFIAYMILSSGQYRSTH